MQLFAFNLRNLLEEWSAMNASPRIFWNLIGHPGDYVTDFASTHPGTQASSHSNRLALHKQKWKNDKKKIFRRDKPSFFFRYIGKPQVAFVIAALFVFVSWVKQQDLVVVIIY